MTTTQQPNALRLAQHLEQFRSFPDDLAAADELRRLHARIAELEAQLSATPAAQEGWCDGCNPDNCVGCGPAAPAQMQPKPSRENNHDH